MGELAAFVGWDWADKKHDLCPMTLAKYRETFSSSRAKDEPTHAEYAAELVMRHRDRLKAWRPEEERTRTLQYLVEHRRRVVSDRTRVSNQMTTLLKLYFQQVLELFNDIRTDLVCDFLRERLHHRTRMDYIAGTK